MNTFENIIYECVKETLDNIGSALKKALGENKGIEEFLYPYVNVCIFNKLKDRPIVRLGQGRFSMINEDKPDFILEVGCDESECNLVLGELKLAKKLNDLMFGYQSGNFDCGGKLAGIVKENDLFGVRLCDKGAKGKKTIKDGFLVDILKLRNLILEYRIFERGEKNIYSIAIGIVEFQDAYKKCIEQLKNKLEKGIGRILQEQSFLPHFEEARKEEVEKISDNIEFRLDLEKFNDFVLFRCDIFEK